MDRNARIGLTIAIFEMEIEKEPVAWICNLTQGAYGHEGGFLAKFRVRVGVCRPQFQNDTVG